MRKPRYEKNLAAQLESLGCPTPEMEYRFHPTRKWRFDLAWPSIMLAVELHGSVWTQGRHTRGSGFVGDREKIREAIKLGWSVLEYPTEDVKHWTAALEIKEVINARPVSL